MKKDNLSVQYSKSRKEEALFNLKNKVNNYNSELSQTNHTLQTFLSLLSKNKTNVQIHNNSIPNNTLRSDEATDAFANTSSYPVLLPIVNVSSNHLCFTRSYSNQISDSFLRRDFSSTPNQLRKGISEENFISFIDSDDSYKVTSDYVIPTKSNSVNQNVDNLPSGCVFENDDISSMTVICSGKDMKSVPIFKYIRSVDVLVFNYTGIQILDRKAIEGLPRVIHLEFRNGVLMRVSFGELLKYQPEMTNLSLIHNSISSLSFSNFYIEEEDKNNVIQILNLQENLITNLPQSPIDGLPVLLGLKTLILSGNPMGVLPGDIFYPLRKSPLKTLYLQNSGLEDFGVPTLAGRGGESPLAFTKQLEKLDLSRNPLLYPEKLYGLISPLNNTHLKELILNDNSYIEVPKAALDVVRDSLEYLSLMRSSLYCLDNSSFPVMTKLSLLNLQYSRISQIKEGSFNSLLSLETLRLDGNLLTTISPALSLRSLKVLTLDDNPSEDVNVDSGFSISKGSLNNSQGLETLSMMEVPLKKICNYFFRNLNTLISLRLSGSSISLIEDNSFIDQINLKILLLGSNKLESINESTFAGLINLQHLDLSDNALNFYSDSDAANKKSLTNKTHGPYLTGKYKRNQIKDVRAETMKMENSSYINSASFLNLSSLRSLNLRYNNINNLNPSIFESMVSLRELDLSYNRIKKWNEPLFQNSRNLYVLSLRNNEIETITEAMITDFNKSNLIIDLRDNPFVCSCSLVAFENELNETHFIDKESYLCWNDTNSVNIRTYVDSIEEDCYRSMGEVEEMYPNHLKLYVILTLFFAFCFTISLTTYRNRWYLKYLAYKLRVRVKYKSDRSECGSYEYDTFICYAQSDRQWIFEKLVGKLEATGNGLRVCVHERDFLVGEEITHNIIRSVEISRKVIVVISRAFVQSTWCMFELQMASNKILDERKNKLILLLLEPIPENEQPKELKLLLKSRTYVSWVSDIEGERLFWMRLLRAISKPTSEKEQNVSESSTDQFVQRSKISVSSSSSWIESEEETFGEVRKSIEESDDPVTLKEFSAINYRLSFSEYLKNADSEEKDLTNYVNKCFEGDRIQ